MDSEEFRVLLQDFYSSWYRSMFTFESPVATRNHLVGSADHLFRNSLQTDLKIADIGSGAQQLIEDLVKNNPYLITENNLFIITVDFALIHPLSLVMAEEEWVSHTIADGAAIPLQDNSLDFVLSNMALDLMNRNVFCQVSRVLKSNGILICNLHHPHLLSSDFIKGAPSYMLKNLIFDNENQILDTFSLMFKKIQVTLCSRDDYFWWNVLAVNH